MLKKYETARARFMVALAAMALAAPACSFGKPDIATVPDHPTFEIDVKPLLADHCLLCHGYPATRNAPTSFRLDVYTSPDGMTAAYQEADRFIRSIQNDKMPPSAKWGDGVGPNGKKMLQNWAADGYPD
jgi:hypothetical protein